MKNKKAIIMLAMIFIVLLSSLSYASCEEPLSDVDTYAYSSDTNQLGGFYYSDDDYLGDPTDTSEYVAESANLYAYSTEDCPNCDVIDILLGYDQLGRPVCDSASAKCREDNPNYVDAIVAAGQITEQQHEIRRQLYTIAGFADSMISMGEAWANIYSLFNGGNKIDENWLDNFPDDIAAYYGIDNYINYKICNLPTDEEQVTTSVFTKEGDVGLHLEGYKVPYEGTVPCETNHSICTSLFNTLNACNDGICVKKTLEPETYTQNIYRITFMIDASKEVIKEGEEIEFDVLLYKEDGTTEAADVNGDDDNTNDHVTLKSGSGVFSVTGQDQIVFGSKEEYTKVCLEFDDITLFTMEFRQLIEDVGGSSFCNSFVAEGHKTKAGTGWFANLVTLGLGSSPKSTAGLLTLGAAGGSSI